MIKSSVHAAQSIAARIDGASILAGSGHIAGVVNPQEANKYGYWTNRRNPPAPDDWCNSAEKHAGSWWPEWQAWIAEFGNGKVPTRHPGDGELKALEDAPGSFVKLQAQD